MIYGQETLEETAARHEHELAQARRQVASDFIWPTSIGVALAFYVATHSWASILAIPAAYLLIMRPYRSRERATEAVCRGLHERAQLSRR